MTSILHPGPYALDITSSDVVNLRSEQHAMEDESVTRLKRRLALGHQ